MKEKEEDMKIRIVVKLFILGLAVIAFVSTGVEQVVAVSEDDLDEALEKDKFYIGSERCKDCHKMQYYSWRRHLHSRMTQDIKHNKRALIVELDEKRIRKDLAKLKLKIPVDKVYVPKIEELKYTIGSKWKQRYIVEKEGTLYIAPIQYNADTGRFVNYHEDDWDKRPWLLKCGGCHATGVDLEKQTFIEPAVACEA